MNNRLYRGDCKIIADTLIKEGVRVDLIYLDPPFNSNRTYSMLFNHRGIAAQQKAYHDMWDFTDSTRQLVLDFKEELKQWDLPDSFKEFMKAWLQILEGGTAEDRRLLNYLMYITQRLIRLKDLLAPTGSIYFHCDPTASHYIKVIMDGIFGRKNFRNEIVWCYSRPSAPKQKQLSRVHDTIFWYSKGQNWTFNPDQIRQPYSESSRAREGYSANASKVADGTVQLDSTGKFPESWIYIPPLKGNSKEYRGYVTQKPIALLNRILGGVK